MLPAEGHSLRRNIFYAVTGNGILNLCRLIVIVLLAKFAGAEIQGTYTYASIALAAPVVLFCGLELRAAFVADAGGEFTFGAYRALRSIGMGVATVVLAGVALWTTRHEPSPARTWLILAVCGGRVVFGLAEVNWGVFQRRERLDLMAWSNGLRGVALLVPFAVLFLWRGRGGVGVAAPTMAAVAWAAGVYVAAWGAIWWFFDRPQAAGRGDVSLSWTWGDLFRLARNTLPLGVVILLINLCETLTQWYVKRAAGGEAWADLGYFGAMRVITLGATFLIVQVSTAAGNRLAHFYQRDLRAFVRLALKITGVAVAIGGVTIVAAWLFGAGFLNALYTPQYGRHATAFMILVSSQAIALLAAVFGIVTTHMRRFWIQVPVHLCVLVATGVAGAVLVTPASPVLGGAWTTLVRHVTQTCLYLVCVVLGVRWQRAANRGSGG